MRSRRWSGTWIAAAWVAPLVWLVLALSAPSDGTVISSPTAVLGDDRWGDSVTVVDAYGASPLQPGDQVLAIDQRPIPEWFDDLGAADVATGDVLEYRVRRGAAGLDRIQDVEVPLTAYPLGSALLANLARVLLAVGLLLAGTFLVLRRARPVWALSTLAAGSAAGFGLSAPPFGPQVVDLVDRGFAPSLVGELGTALALGALLVAAVSFPVPPAVLQRRPVLLAGTALVPLAGYAVWLLLYATQQPWPARLQASLDASLPATLTAAVVGVPALVAGYRRADEPEARVSVRLLLVAGLTTALLGLVLDLVPTWLRGRPLVPWELMAIALVPLVLACWVAAVLGYRLLEVDALLRRSLVQLVLATLLGALFLSGVGAATVTSGGSLQSMVVGGVVVMILVPVALGLRRAIRRLVYGERADPARLVSRLRRLDASTEPEEALRETLELLQRSLQLSYVAIEAAGPDEERVDIAIGELRGRPTSVDLEVGGRPLGRLDLEVSVMRDPFGARDRRLLEDVGTQVGALVQALVANRQLQLARERLVAAREEERRRLRRDLHDGLGPSLASMLMRLELARELIAADPGRATDLVAQLTDQTERSIAEIRRLVDGLRPPILDQLGLASALRTHADEHNRVSGLARDGLAWSVESDDLGTLPAAVEVAAYRIVTEAVNNAIRHSHGSRCDVQLRRQGTVLEVDIRDDGLGADVVAGRGVGLGSMHERAAEVGGTCVVRTPSTGGTLVSARIPLPLEEGTT